MDILTAISGIGAGLGLSTSAGLNAYIPLLALALAARLPTSDPLVQLSEPYDMLSNWWVIGLLAILLFIEMTVDKIPAVDTVNDLIHTFIRPAAGAFLFAANADIITDISPVLALVAGVFLAGGVHVTKGVARPVVTGATAGTGNWLVSIIEDIVASFMSILAILIPLLAILFFLLIILTIVLLFRRRRKRRLAFR